MGFLLKKENIPWASLLIILAGVTLYSNTLHVPFYLDDYANISQNSAIHLHKLTFKDIFEASRQGPSSTRPLANISLALNYFIHQQNVSGYHYINIIIHILTGLFLFVLLKATFKTPALKAKYSYSNLIAFWTVIFWFAHPIQTQAVTYIVQRMTSMSAMFYLLALWLYVKGRFSDDSKGSFLYFSGTAISWLMAMGCKEIAVTLPFFLFFYEWIFFQKGKAVWLKKSLPYLLGILFIFFLLAVLYFGKNPWHSMLKGYGFRHFSPTERVLTEFRILFFYVSLMVLPLPGRMGLEHDFTLSSSLFQPMTTFASFCGIVILIFTALFTAKRHPLLSFSILWFLGNLVVESTIIPLELVFEHRLYLPSMFFFLPLCATVLQVEKYHKISLLCFTCCFVLLGASTYARNSDWKDPVIFWQKNISIAPKNERAHNNLGAVLLRQKKPVEAEPYLQESIRLNPFFSPAYNNLGLVYLHQRRLPDAAKYFQQALSYDPNIFEAYLNLGGIYGEMGNYQLGLTYLQKAVRMRPSSAAAHNNLANLLQLLGRYGEAIRHYDEALIYAPQYEDARYNRQVAIKRLKQAEQKLKE